MVIDIISFNGEYDLFELRYNTLKDYVDEFRVIEFDKTFSGKPKEWLFDSLLAEKQYTHLVNYQLSEVDYIKYKDLAESSPNTQGAEHWKLEFMQKESIKDCLTDLKDNDTVFIGDCDEIWERDSNFEDPKKLKLKVYTYWLNNKSNEQFWGTLVAKYKDIKNICLNHLRVNADKTIQEYGWHFTSLKDGLEKKLTDSYTEESYATKQVMENLQDNINNNRDFLGRDFTYEIDESEWPEYLKNNRQKYLHLLK